MNALQTQTNNQGAALAPAPTGDIFTNAGNMLQLADAIKDSSFLPAALRGDPGNAFLAIELASRTGLPLMATLQGMYVIEGRDGRSVGKPSFYANFIHALIRKSGAFVDTYYREGEDGKHNGQPNKTCQLIGVRPDGTEVEGPVVSLAMAAKAGWSSRNAQMWGAYTQTMLQNRAVTFFARQCCPELIFGIDPDAEIRSAAVDDEPPAEALKARLAQYARKPEPVEAEVVEEGPEPAPKPKRARKGAPIKPDPIETPTYNGVGIGDEDVAPEPLGEFAAWYADKIDAAETLEALAEIGQKIRRDFAGPEYEKDVLRNLYAEKEAALGGKQNA